MGLSQTFRVSQETSRRRCFIFRQAPAGPAIGPNFEENTPPSYLEA